MTLIEQIPENSKLLVAVSGGPDSVYLLYQLVELAPKKNFSLVVGHYNHRVRKEAADGDENFVIDLAKKNNLSVVVEKNDDLMDQSENGLRKKRYSFLQKTKVKHNCDFIVTAHTRDDQIETIIFNFIRGTGPKGLIGIKWKNGDLLRPLLDVDKGQILQFLQEKNYLFCNDQTNYQLDYTRNYIRQIIVPQIARINPNYREGIGNLSEIVARQQDFVNEQMLLVLRKIILWVVGPIEKWKEIVEVGLVKKKKRMICLDLKKFNNRHVLLRTSILYYLIFPLVPEGKQLNSKQIIEVDNILQKARGGSKKILFDTLSIEKKNGKITVYKLVTKQKNK